MFEPTCGNGEVIILQKALYGMINIGRCMKRDIGVHNCFSNELHYFDKLCSGKQKCELIIPSPQLAAKQECLSGFNSYLEASYFCQKGIISKCPHKIYLMLH